MPDKKEEKVEPVDFLKSYVDPHTKVSRDVTNDDIETVTKDAHVLYNLCYTQRGPYPGGFAMAHPQINDKDPLRFFVTQDKEIVINPVITRHTRHTVSGLEGCMSHPDKLMIEVDRWNKCEVEYYTLSQDGEALKLGDKRKESLKGKRARIFQHEIEHFTNKSIYDTIDT